MNPERSTEYLDDKTVSFETAQGSQYVSDEFGRTSRHKTVEGKDYPQSGVTVYLDHKFHQYISSLTYHNEDAKVRLVELRNGKLFRIKDISDVLDKDEVRLIFTDKKDESQFIPLKDPSGEIVPAIFTVSFEPSIGSHPFELKYDEDNNKTYHYGNPITKINLQQ